MGGFMRTLSIGARLALGFGLLCALLAAVSGMAALESSEVDRAVAQIVDYRMPVSQTSSELEMKLYASLAALRGYLLTGNDQFKQDRKEAWTAIDSQSVAMDGFSKGFTNSTNIELWRNGRQLLAELKAAQDKAEAAGVGEEGVKILAGEAVPRVRKLVAIFEGDLQPDGSRSGGLVRNQRQMLVNDADQARTATSRMTIAAWVGLLVGLVLALFIAIATRRSIVPPIVATTEAMGHLAAGDLNVRIEGRERGDEIGRMAQALEVFRAGLARQKELEASQRAEEKSRMERAARIEAMTRAFDQDASGSVQLVASAATQLQTTAGAMSATAVQTSNQAGAVASASEQAAGNVQTVSAAAEELTVAISEISRQVIHSREISDQAADEAVKAGHVVEDLAGAVQKIGDVVNLINEIASQTNLLALNATIEAARAGEAGKGFAVVANEVKHLANQTARATGEISQQITSVQDQTARVVETIRGIVAIIQDLGGTATGIAAAVEEQAAATSDIARNVEAAAQGTTEVSNNVVGLQEAAGQTGISAREVLEASGELNLQAGSLNRLIAGFLQDVRQA